MSGHSGFMPIGGARQTSVIAVSESIGEDNANVSNVGGVNVGNVGGANGNQAVDFHAAAEESFKAVSLVKELDSLLTKAASKARVGISGDDMAKAAGKAKLAPATAAALKKAAIAANKTMRALDGFTGAELAKAMVKKDDGTIDWDGNNPAGKAIKAAVEHVILMAAKAHNLKDDAFRTSGALLGVFKGDRHGNNYMVEVGADLSVTVKGIDNDASFGAFRIGLRKFRITDQRAIDRFNSELAQYVSYFKGNEQAVYNELQNDPGVNDLDGTITVDLSKIKSPALAYIVRKSLGAKTLAVPKDIDKDLYDKLVALRGGAARRNYLKELRTRLGDDTPQYRAAMQRLDDAILYAMKLNELGRVYTKEQWETKEIQREVASHQPKTEVKQLGGQATMANEQAENAYGSSITSTLSNNLFFRDIEKGIKRPGWFDPSRGM